MAFSIFLTFLFRCFIHQYFTSLTTNKVCLKHQCSCDLLSFFFYSTTLMWSSVPLCTSYFSESLYDKERENKGHRVKECKSEGRGERERARESGKESLQGKWMVGMHVDAGWMSCTLGWGVLEVLCWCSRGHSGCEWHQNNISWQTTLVKGCGQADHTLSSTNYSFLR